MGCKVYLTKSPVKLNILLFHRYGVPVQTDVFQVKQLMYFIQNTSAGHASYFCRCVMRRRVMLFYRRITSHRGVFSNKFPASMPFRVTRHKLSALKLVSTPIHAHTASGQTLPSPPIGQPHPSPPSGHLPPILLAVKLSPLRPVVILPPC